MTDAFVIREDRAEDGGAIRRLLELAFGGPGEADLVDALRSAGGVTLSLLALEGSTIVAQVVFSPVVVRSQKGCIDALGLGPMAVVPHRQRRGIGTELLRAGLARLRDARHRAVVVLGHPAYYPRFGFRRASELGIAWEHAAPDEAFMALELEPKSLEGVAGVVCYRPEFDEPS